MALRQRARPERPGEGHHPALGDNGAPRGDAKDLPPSPKYVEGWALGQPDAVVSMPVDYKVPADGFVEYEYFEIPTNFTEDKWVQSVEIGGGARRGPSRHRHDAPAEA